MIEWRYEEMNITRPTDHKFLDNKAYLTIKGVSKADAGSYLCIVDNGIGEPVNKSIFLIVKRKFVLQTILFLKFKGIANTF